jgi:hypothetical protein
MEDFSRLAAIFFPDIDAAMARDASRFWINMTFSGSSGSLGDFA